VLLELVVRVLPLDEGFFLLPEPANCLRRDPVLSMSFRPSCDGELRGTRMTTNELGLRGPAVDHGARIILAAGDSCTWGWEVAQDASYPADLQRLLDERALEHRYQVVNAGVPGYTSHQGLEYLRDRGLQLDPAVLILAYGFNDLFETGDVEAQIARERALATALEVDDFLLSHSSLYRWTRWQVAKRQPRKQGVRVTAAKYRANLEAMVDLGRRHGARVMLLSFWPPAAPETEYRDAVAEVAADRQVPLISYRGPLIDVVHPTAEGYRLLAGEIAARLVAEGFVR
jgi:lysophospholipase L1-like esterase